MISKLKVIDSLSLEIFLKSKESSDSWWPEMSKMPVGFADGQLCPKQIRLKKKKVHFVGFLTKSLSLSLF